MNHLLVAPDGAGGALLHGVVFALPRFGRPRLLLLRVYLLLRICLLVIIVCKRNPSPISRATAVPSLPRRRRRNPKRRHRRWSRCVDTEAGYRGRSLVAVSRTYDATAHGAGRTGFLPLDACAATALLLLRWRVIIGIVCAAVCPASSHKERVVYGAAAALGARHWDKGGCEQWACPGWVRGCVCLWSAEGVELRRRREP
jgi:hypothetical protein